MAYGLPSRGQRDWDDELNNSMEALRADVQSTVATAGVAASDAAYARNRADEVHTAVIGTADAAVAGFIADDGSATGQAISSALGALDGAYVAALGLRGSIEADITTGIAVLGDSTGNETAEWAYLLAQNVATAHPEYTVQHALWSDAAQDIALPTVIQTGTAGEMYLDSGTGSTTRTIPLAETVHTSGVIDVRAKVRMDDWTPSAIAVTVAREGGAGLRSWYFGIATTGKLGFWYSVDGTTLISDKLSTVSVAFADGAVGWIRGVYTPSTDVKFYTSPDGVTWTQLGTSLAHAHGAVFNATTPYELGGRQNGNIYAGQDIYHIDVRDGLAGKPIVPISPAAWGAGAVTAVGITGAPVFTVVNGSHPGADLAYWTQTRIDKALPSYGQRLAFLSLSHNELAQSGPTFASRYATTLAAMKSRMPGVPLVGLTQNPQKAPRSTVFINAQAARRVDIFTAAASAGATYIDIYQAFVDAGLATTVDGADGVHPTAAGSLVWRDAVLAATGLA